jgi:NADH:ubiquinone oxidoreductase subunit B-like Fe-S oxidoreductase
MLTLWSRVPHEIVILGELFKKSSAFHGSRRKIFAFTRDCVPKPDKFNCAICTLLKKKTYEQRKRQEEGKSKKRKQRIKREEESRIKHKRSAEIKCFYLHGFE